MKPLQRLQSTIDSLTDEAKRRTFEGEITTDDTEGDTSDTASTDGDDNSDVIYDSDRGRPTAASRTTNESNTTETDDTATGSGDWTVADTEIEKTMYGVTWTENGPYAVGDSGTVAGRGRDGDWTVVVPSGPAVKRNTLNAVDVTDDGERIWFAGSSGAIGMYDTTTGRKYNYSAPMEMTSTWEAIGIAGERGDERLFVANGSGEVLRAVIDENDCPAFGEPVKPGSGSTVPALTVREDVAYAVDTSGNVFERRDEEWTTVGIRNAQINFTDVDVGPEGSVLVTGGGGIVYRYDATCENWTPVAVGTVVLRGIDRRDGDVAVVGDGGRAYERRLREGWTGVETDVEATLHAIALGPTDVAVGEGGVIVERQSREQTGTTTDVVTGPGSTGREDGVET